MIRRVVLSLIGGGQGDETIMFSDGCWQELLDGVDRCVKRGASEIAEGLLGKTLGQRIDGSEATRRERGSAHLLPFGTRHRQRVVTGVEFAADRDFVANLKLFCDEVGEPGDLE